MKRKYGAHFLGRTPRRTCASQSINDESGGDGVRLGGSTCMIVEPGTKKCFVSAISVDDNDEVLLMMMMVEQ